MQVEPLDKPKGAKAYVMKIALETGQLYVKLQLSGRKIVGRSFHYSYFD